MVPAMPINALVLTTSLAAAAASTPADSLLRSGPMVGYSEMREVLLWVQTKRPARVRFAYWEEDNPAARRLTRETTTVA
jgi:alkaline phosphatase D